MTSLLHLTADFVENMANPARGVAANEEAAMRFAKYLSQEGSGNDFLSEARALRDPDTFSPHGWLWILNWTKTRRQKMNDDLLFDLCETWSNVFFKCAVLDHATRFERVGKPDQDPEELTTFPHSLLRRLLESVIGRAADEEGQHIRLREAESLLVALLQTGHDLTIRAAAALLHHPWAGQRDLNRSFQQLLDGLEDETRDVWERALKPPTIP